MTNSARRPAAPAAVVALLGFGLAVAVVAVVGGLAAATSAQQYGGLVQPAWAPPAWLFGPVWTVLYVLIAVSGWLVWRRAGLTGPAHVVYGIQLLLNMAWTPLFFGAGFLGLASVEIVLLWIAVLTTIVLFARIDRPAAWLLCPYAAWVTFAGALNLAIWVLN
jgi:tryptophan-rich sensory protein